MPYHSTQKTFDELLVPRAKVSEATALYMLNMIRSLAQSLIGIFLPIYIYEIASDMIIFHVDRVINGLIWVVLYYMIRSLVVSTTITFALPMMFNRLKFKGSLAFANILLIFQFVALLFAPDYPLLLLLAALLQGIVITFYWIPYHSFFEQKARGSDGHFGKEVGIRIILTKIVGVIAPLIGGFIIAIYGFSVIFMLSISLLLISILPILIFINEKPHHKHSAKRVYKNMLLNPKFKKLTLAYIGSAMDSNIFTIFWPIVLLVVVESYEKIGILSSVSTIFSMVAAIIVSRLIDKRGMKKVHLVGVLVNALLYIPRMFVSTPMFVYGLDIVDKTNSASYNIPNIAQTYEKGVKLGGADYFVYREMALHMPIVAILAVVILLLWVLPDWRVIFTFAIVGSLMTYLLSLDKN